MPSPTVGDIGTVIRVTFPEDISDASSLKMTMRKPNGETVVWDGTLVGTTDVEYTTTAGDLDVDGLWSGKIYAIFPDWSGYSTRFYVPVAERIADAS